jgi:hypothetical protein
VKKGAGDRPYNELPEVQVAFMVSLVLVAWYSGSSHQSKPSWWLPAFFGLLYSRRF